MSVLTTMNNKMDQYERSKDERTDSASVHAVYVVPPEPSTSRATVEDGPARHSGAAVPDRYCNVAEEGWACVASHLWGTPALFVSADNDSGSDEGCCQLAGRED